MFKYIKKLLYQAFRECERPKCKISRDLQLKQSLESRLLLQQFHVQASYD
jgi:hypothetical protein